MLPATIFQVVQTFSRAKLAVSWMLACDLTTPHCQLAGVTLKASQLYLCGTFNKQGKSMYFTRLKAQLL